MSADQRTRVVFLAGPPGSGKSTLGQRACEALGLRFLDFDRGGDCTSSTMEVIAAALDRRSADVVTLPWELQIRPSTLASCRRTGSVIALWAHPLEMQSRSGLTTPLFTPVKRLTTGGGFGRRGTGCPEFRRLDRACSLVLLLDGLSFEEAVADVQDAIKGLRLTESGAVAGREGLDAWVDEWKRCGAGAEAARVLADAMARYIRHLKETGASPRKVAAICRDLQAAGILVAMYEDSGPNRILGHFSSPPWTFEFSRKFSDAPAAVARYEGSLRGFASFLRDVGLVRGA